MQPGLGAVLLAMLACSAVTAAERLELVRDGQPRASLVIDSRRYPLREDLTNQWAIEKRTIASIAGTVVEYVRKRTGATLPIVDLATQPLPAEGCLVHVGRGEYTDEVVGDELDGLDPSGYLIRAVGDRRLIIAGPTSEGTEFGTYEFLERLLGVRWLFPTEVGEYVPRARDLSVPGDTNIRDEPAFMQVPLVASKPTHQTWARRMRFWTRLNFHHSLVDLFPPARYRETHPEFFPVLRPGTTERYVPADSDYNWQPCFTEPALVDEAVANIIRYLDANPRIRSYSFGVNDSNLYCQCDRCRAQYIPGEQFLGMACYSDAYFRWVNAVADRVLEVHPDAWFGCLAYSHVGKPPVNIGVHPRVVPFLTYDTMQLLDPERRREHETLVQAWADKCTFLGRYDYTYGDHHVPPRLYLHHWADYVRWARDHRVRAWYAETYPFFGEGPKYYVMAKVWWDPDRDVDQLLDEWYRLAFGAAAPPMQAYFAHWEDYWTRRVPRTDYFRRCRHEQYMMGGPGWLEALRPADVQQADAWIAAAQRRADTPETRARVAVMARSWEYYRAVMETYLARRGADGSLSVEQALDLLGGGSEVLTQPLWALHQELMADPVLTFTWESSYPYGDAERVQALDAVETYLDSTDARLAAKLLELSQGPNSGLAALARTAMAVANGGAPDLVPNSGFEAEDPLDGWWSGMHFGTGTCRVIEDEPYEGRHAVEVTGTADGYGGVFRTDVPVQPGKRYLFVLRGRWEGEPGVATVCQMITQFHDARGQALPDTLRSNRFRDTEVWRAHALLTLPAPAAATTMTVRVDALYQPKTGHRALFDALRAYEVADADKP